MTRLRSKTLAVKIDGTVRYTIRYTTMALILGVLGARNALTKQSMQDEILGPILDDLEQKPAKILLPAEPLSSTYIECWASRQDIPVDLIKSDWVRNGRRAGVLRDAAIEKEATALLIFEGPKSRYYLDLAERIAKRHTMIPVYVVAANSVSPVLLEVDREAHITINAKDENDILKPQNTLTQMWNKTKCLITDD